MNVIAVFPYFRCDCKGESACGVRNNGVSVSLGGGGERNNGMFVSG